MSGMNYQRRIIDDELDELLEQLPAIAVEGPKAVGKTATASRRAGTIHELDDPSTMSIADADPARLLDGDPPVLIDEWQRLPEVWDLVRREVDRDQSPGRFLLAGSASPGEAAIHTGAGRIVSLRMRPLSIAERARSEPSVRLGDLLKGERGALGGASGWSLVDYVEAILESGFPGIRSLTGRARRSQLDAYIDRIVDREFTELGHRIRDPGMLRRWMEAYAAASSTTTTFEKIRAAAGRDSGQMPSRPATEPYRRILERLWILDPVPAWAPSRNRITRLTLPPKHQLADPSLAARLLGVDANALLEGVEVGPPIPRDGVLLGALFESLVTLSVKVYAQAHEARVGHLRTSGGRHEVDLVVIRPDGRVVAIEVKLSRNISDGDTQHLRWLAEHIGDELLDAVVITTGREAYRRADGIAVVPAALLGH